MLRVGCRDLFGYGALDEITSELSSLASAALDTAYRFCLNLLKSSYGAPYYRDETGALKECTFVVLGMGKLGGNELNFSSDIDLIYLYQSDEGETRGGDRTYTLYEFYCKMSELITKAISANTEDGFVFRVDLRLRPEGQNGPVANSIASAMIYYESWGETWERSAMVKARPVAGNLSLGDSFLKELEPFIYRKYLDFTTIEDIKEMKLKIDRELALKPGMWDVKLGSGGIREIEFLVQATQLIHAGKDKALRERNTLKSLQKLKDKGLLTHEDHETLAAAYRFLRTVEHRIQVENERQTHKLPAKAEDIKRLAKRCGFMELADFKKALEFHSGDVERLYDGIFHEPSRSVEDVPPEVIHIFSPEADKDEVVRRLSSMGFEDTEAAYRRLDALREAGPSSRLSHRSRTALRRLAPRLFLEASKSPDPDMAIVNLERFLNAVGAKGGFYSLLLENPKMIRFLAALFGTSEFLSHFLIAHPELLDTLLRADTVTPVKRKEELGLPEVSAQLTTIEDISLETELKVSLEEIRTRYGAPFLSDGSEAVISVIGMGKLGGGEMNYSSDLDLIFIYSGGGETKGPKVITNQEYFARVAQKVISFLTLQTREGYLYKVDTRLRPSGSAGTLVSSLDAFMAYHRESARLWERQALIKARCVAGDAEFGEKVARSIASVVYNPGIDDEGRKEMCHLRERMEKELAREGPERYNVKSGRGGIVDIEFTTQFLQLKHGTELVGLRNPKTLDALKAVFDAGLIEPEDYSALKDAYLFLMKTENRLRILHNISTDQMDLDAGRLAKLARRLGYESQGADAPGDIFLRDYRSHTEKVREIYNRIVVRGQ
ncbi:MAG: bifunctional [glutamate--ammonia ligase]-adenylyl-L-tyrosine phosphorylase/[glutamate--ammonia-ligase] adenylyltransferase [Deltaproteobacteria bacterium]|nr:bifunctional [glutamate--ammonia ligase]-adenylyl-L-tyrosine phosphorylase/[glutamate--ammonia-ligase] adenylyltransferase [Deltaproteobacteria bacterium]